MLTLIPVFSKDVFWYYWAHTDGGSCKYASWVNFNVSLMLVLKKHVFWYYWPHTAPINVYLLLGMWMYAHCKYISSDVVTMISLITSYIPGPSKWENSSLIDIFYVISTACVSQQWTKSKEVAAILFEQWLDSMKGREVATWLTTGHPWWEYMRALTQANRHSKNPILPFLFDCIYYGQKGSGPQDTMEGADRTEICRRKEAIIKTQLPHLVAGDS